MPGNVLQLISSAGYFGAENVIVSLSEALENHDCRSVIGVFHNEYQQNEELIRQAERRGLSVLKIFCNGRWDWRTVKSIRKTIEQLNIDVLHTHGYKADIYGFLAARSLKLPRISTCHLWTQNTAAVRVYEFLDSLLLRKFDAVVAVSDQIAKSLYLSGIRPSRVCVIDNGIDLMSFSEGRATNPEPATTEPRLVVGTVGRLVPQKGLEYFLRAAREILLDFPDVTFVIIGDGPDREKLEQMARDLAIANHVVFTGLTTNMPEAYASMNVFALASIDEGMPMAILEALASKTPVVATSVGAVPRLILSGKTGFLVAPRDVQALKLAILKLLKDSDLRSQFGIAGQELVKRRHSRDIMARNYLRLYKQIAAGKAIGAPAIGSEPLWK